MTSVMYQPQSPISGFHWNVSCFLPPALLYSIYDMLRKGYKSTPFTFLSTICSWPWLVNKTKISYMSINRIDYSSQSALYIKSKINEITTN